MELNGELVDVVYQNEVNSYLIGTLETEEEIITIVGYMPFVKIGDNIKVIGKYVEHKEYGRQFKVDTFEKIIPQTVSAIEKYLANSDIKGIGGAIAKRITKKFGEETVNIIRNQPQKLVEVKGITKEKAEEISQEFIENWEVWQIVSFLDKFGIGAQHAKKVYKLYGINAIEQIKTNPYILLDISRGVDFKQIDRVALSIGISEENEKRIQYAIKYALIIASNNGHCCVIKQNLITFVENLLNISESLIKDNLIDLRAQDEIIIEKIDEQEWIYLTYFYNTEQEIAERLSKLKNSKNIKKVDNIENQIIEVEKHNEIKLSEKQKEAIKQINENNVVIITGGPGTGKTTIIEAIIQIYEKRKNKVILCAPTGRAAKRMTETTKKEASTLHRLLEIGKIDEESLYKNNTQYEGMPIDADIIIVDEVSMVDMFLMNYLLKCIYKGTKLILVGDINQLASVGPGSVLKDIIDSTTITTVYLDKIFRQAAKSKIILNAHRVNNGENFIKKQELSEETNNDFFFISEKSQEKILLEVLSLCTGRLQNYGNYNFFENIQILTPTKKGMLGTKQLNQELQQILNPKTERTLEKQYGSVIYRTGDRIMQIKNNYDIEWEKTQNGKKVFGKGVFNGEIGTVKNINEKEKQIKIQYDDQKIAYYEFSELEQIEHSYAITIHKAQGSEYDVVIMVIPQAAPMLLTRNLLYTGITRAKKLLIIISTENIIQYMIQNVDIKKRNTGLKFKLKNFRS